MTNKTLQAYQDVFQFIEDNLFKMEPQSFMTDFEDAMRTAIKNRWPNCEINGCWFHFKQAVQRRCNILPGMKRLLNKSFHARKIKNMLMSIPLLPEDKIKEGYQSIQDYSKKWKLDAQFAELFAYFERQWLREVRLIKRFN